MGGREEGRAARRNGSTRSAHSPAAELAAHDAVTPLCATAADESSYTLHSPASAGLELSPFSAYHFWPLAAPLASLTNQYLFPYAQVATYMKYVPPDACVK